MASPFLIGRRQGPGRLWHSLCPLGAFSRSSVCWTLLSQPLSEALGYRRLLLSPGWFSACQHPDRTAVCVLRGSGEGWALNLDRCLRTQWGPCEGSARSLVLLFPSAITLPTPTVPALPPRCSSKVPTPPLAHQELSHFASHLRSENFITGIIPELFSPGEVKIF